MNALANHRFLKLNGLGNEITVLDLRGTALLVDAAGARAIAASRDSRFDQLMVLHDPRSPGTDAYLRIYNTDGSEAGACGNGTRCVAWAMMADPVMADTGSGGSTGRDLILETRAGRLPTRRVSETVFTVDMGAPILDWSGIPLAGPFPDTREIEVQTHLPEAPELRHPSAVGMGNPHAIFFVDDPAAYDLSRIGPLLEHDPVFPDRANITLARVAGPDHLVLRVWERGAGLTRACGSAACATVVAAARKGLTGRDVTVSLPGGDLAIAWRPDDDHVLMTGPVAFEHEGILAPILFAGAA